MSRYIAVVVLALLCTLCVFAQSSTGTLTGIVTDPSKANLPSVSLELINESTGVTEHAVTNQLGDYTFPILPPGTCRLNAQATGFRTWVRQRSV